MSNNEGQVFAAAVDAEIAKFRSLQEELKNLQNDLSIVLGQETENEMVMVELDLLPTGGSTEESDEAAGGSSSSGGAVVYKLLGPILLPQDLEESKQTVQKRLEFIRNEKNRLQTKIASTEQKGEELAKKISSMQSNLQRTTAEAVRAIAAQHGGKQ